MMRKGAHVTLSFVNGVVPSRLRSIGYVSGEFYPVSDVWETAMGDFARVAFPEGELTFPVEMLVMLVEAETIFISADV